MSVGGDPRTIDVRVLGALDVRVDGVPVPVPGAKPRATLTILALNPRRVIAADTLAAALWGDRVPRTSHKALLTHISVLRRVLGEAVIETQGAGWRLALPRTDASDFENAVAAGRRALEYGQPNEAAALLSEALQLWRGAPELPATPRMRAELTRWIEQYESVRDDRIDALLASGKAAELIGELEAAVADAPLRERRWSQLCLALYRAGRQGDALRAYQRARTIMSEELGVDPGPELRWLESAVLAQDPRLERPPGRPSADQLARPLTPAQSPAQSPVHRPEPALPSTATPFIGRSAELSAIEDLLTSHRMVTIAGPGGVGKTRLAVAAAEAFWRGKEGEVTFVDLVPATSDFVAEAVAAAIGIDEDPHRSLVEAIVDRLSAEPWLIVLDNCEHVIDAVGALAAELQLSCPSVTLLATSRERLGVHGEQVFAAPPMSLVGPDTRSPKGSDAAMLFLERARAVDPDVDADLDLVGQLCERLDGLPLAIELAAARCASLGVDGLLAGLDDRLDLLSGARGGDGRHSSLRAMLQWSHDLLSPDERTVFRRIGVFVGGFDLMGVAGVAHGAVAGAKLVGVVGRLVDKSLLVHGRSPAGSRWHLLEVVRQFALERLAESDDEPDVARNYLRWAVATAVQLERWLDTGEPWRDRFDLVSDDLRSALQSPAAEEDLSGGLTLALALARLYERRGAFTLAESTYAAAMSMARTTGDADQVAMAALGGSMSGMLFGVSLARRVDMLEEALAAQPNEPSPLRTRLLARLATELYWSDDRGRSLTLARDAVESARAIADDGALAHALYAQHYVTRGPEHSDERLELAERITALAHARDETQLELAGRAAHVVGLLENGDLSRMNSELTDLEEIANRLDHPEFQWYAAVYRLVRALIVGRFREADDLAAAAADAARHAPEFSVGLFFAEVVTDLRPLAGPERRKRVLDLEEMADRFPRVFVWQCMTTLYAASSGSVGSARVQIAQLARQLLGQQVRDGHWLVGCCLIAEAVAALDVRARRVTPGVTGDAGSTAELGLTDELARALRPYAGHIAVAGRVAAFRGSTSHALGLLAWTLGDSAIAIADLEQAAEQHAQLGATPFELRSLVALADVLDARGAADDAARAVRVRHQVARIRAELGIPG